MPLTSMTGFADLAGVAEGLSWAWEARSVNGRGLDVRVRLPEGFESLEAPVRAAAADGFSRGSISIGLRVGQGARAAGARLNVEALEAAVAAALAAGAFASERGLDLAPMTAADLLGMRGVLEGEGRPPSEDPTVLAALTEQIAPLVAALRGARAAEGESLRRLLSAQLDRIATLAGEARTAAQARAPRAAEALRARLEVALAAAAGSVDDARLAQELALLAVKADVTEEIDRLDSHVAAARALLAAEGPVGRKLDFLAQEFNREANTLCAKAQSAELTAIGLEMKVVVDQMREQVQNVE